MVLQTTTKKNGDKTMSYDFKRHLDCREKELLSYDVQNYEHEDDYYDDVEFYYEMVATALRSVAKDSDELLLLFHNIGWQAHSGATTYKINKDDTDYALGSKFIRDTFMRSFNGFSIYAQEDCIEDVKYFNIVCFTHDCNLIIKVMPKTNL
jgi:hypothetical protein